MGSPPGVRRPRAAWVVLLRIEDRRPTLHLEGRPHSIEPCGSHLATEHLGIREPNCYFQRSSDRAAAARLAASAIPAPCAIHAPSTSASAPSNAAATTLSRAAAAAS